ncbi:MAG: hypothetical protein WBG42_00190, partial [Cryomorphaceae bacterium]
IGDSGPLHSTGRSSINGYEMPYDRIKGAICRTAGIFSESQLDYSISPNKVPICFVIGTCDKIIPYVSRTSEGSDGLCDANLTYPDGAEVDSFTLFGPQYISDIMSEADVYNEILTFCGGGHDTNGCVDEIIESRGTDFITRILTDSYTHGDVLDIVYRYEYGNYSNQCCELGEGEYSYLDKCSCDEDNPFTVTDLPYIDLGGCQFINECGLDSICELTPLSDDFFDPADITSNISLVKCESGLCLQFASSKEKLMNLTYYTEEGKELLSIDERVSQGINILPIPTELPRNRTIILRLEGYENIKFFLRAI